MTEDRVGGNEEQEVFVRENDSGGANEVGGQTAEILSSAPGEGCG